MSQDRRKFVIVVLIALFGVAAVVCFRSYRRKAEFRNFFNNQAEKTWGEVFFDKEFDFCAQTWAESTRLLDSAGEKFLSPSGRYRIESLSGTQSQESGFGVFEHTNNRLILTGEDEFGMIEPKWVLGEKYLVYLRKTYMDDDFATPSVNIANLLTGKMIRLASATYSDCVSRHW